MTKNKDLQELKEEIMYDSHKIPQFLDTSSNQHYNYYVKYNKMFTHLSRLAVELFLSDDEIQNIFDQVEYLAMEIGKNRNDNILLLVFNEFEFYMDKYEEYVSDKELYEIIVNMKKFRKLYYE